VRTRFLALAAIALVGLLYYKPLRSYTATRAQLAHRQSEVQSLRSANRALEQRLADAGRPEELLRQARRLGLVRPGERLFIVNGIAAWRRSVAKRTGR
jgi:cell division protein FtsB